MADRTDTVLDLLPKAVKRRRNRASLATGTWKRILRRELGPRPWSFLSRATGLLVPVAIAIALVFILKEGGLPLPADLGHFLKRLALP